MGRLGLLPRLFSGLVSVPQPSPFPPSSPSGSDGPRPTSVPRPDRTFGTWGCPFRLRRSDSGYRSLRGEDLSLVPHLLLPSTFYDPSLVPLVHPSLRRPHPCPGGSSGPTRGLDIRHFLGVRRPRPSPARSHPSDPKSSCGRRLPSRPGEDRYRPRHHPFHPRTPRDRPRNPCHLQRPSGKTRSTYPVSATASPDPPLPTLTPTATTTSCLPSSGAAVGDGG